LEEEQMKEKRIGVIGIVITDRKNAAPKVNSILSEYSDIIIGRMGIPYKERNVSVIALTFECDTDQIGALTGKLGSIESVDVKSVICT